jgi:hypothetical protein
MLQIVLTKRNLGGVSALTWGEANEGSKASAEKFAKSHGWMVHVLSPSDRGEVIRPAIAYHEFEEKRLANEDYENYLASKGL